MLPCSEECDHISLCYRYVFYSYDYCFCMDICMPICWFVTTSNQIFTARYTRNRTQCMYVYRLSIANLLLKDCRQKFTIFSTCIFVISIYNTTWCKYDKRLVHTYGNVLWMHSLFPEKLNRLWSGNDLI